MSTPTDQRKPVRIITYNAALAGIVKSVNIITTAPSVPSEIKECVQVSAANYALSPVGEIPVYMDDSAHPTGLPTIYINGYTAPS
jgi:hypothetical protein